jgi:hypothetical protein
MKTEIEKKTTAVVEAVERHAQTLRSLILRTPAAKDQNAIRSILEAYEGYTKACEEELIQREITKSRSR